MQKPLLLAQRTRFCALAMERTMEKFKGKVLCETFGSFKEGRGITKGYRGPALLIWGDGRCHHLSNILNVPGNVKYVFDRHSDNAEGGLGPEFDSHNSFSREEGLLLRICYGLGRMPRFYHYDHGKGGDLHISVDLDILEGFPALPWMCTGETRLGDLEDKIGSLMRDKMLMRFDIGGFHDMAADKGTMEDAYGRYYSRLIGMALDTLAAQR